MDLKALGKELKNNWTNFIIFEWSILGDFDYSFKVNPLDYLKYAKEDFKLGTQKDLINAMSNSKRAIECQIDSIITMLGYDYKKFDKWKSYPSTKEMIKKFYIEESIDGLTDRIKLLQVLDITPTFLISKIRSLRNKMEHEYLTPSSQEVRESIEIAELFIHSSTRKISITNRGFYFGSNFNLEEVTMYEGSKYEIYKIYSNYIFFEIEWYSKGSNNIKMTFVRDEPKIMLDDSSPKKNTSYIMTSEDSDYPYILKMIYTKDYDLLAKSFGSETQGKHISYILEQD